MVIEVHRCIRKCCENDNFLVSLIDGMLDFICEVSKKLLQLAVMLRRNIVHQ